MRMTTTRIGRLTQMDLLQGRNLSISFANLEIIIPRAQAPLTMSLNSGNDFRQPYPTL